MNIIIGLEKDGRDADLAECPWCGRLSDLQFEDYVTKHMLWCDCGARAVINFDGNFKKTVYPAAGSLLIGMRHPNTGTVSLYSNYDWYSLPLFLIRRVMNAELGEYCLREAKLTSASPPSEVQIRKFVESGYSEAVAQSLGIEKRASDYRYGDWEHSDREKLNFDMSLSLRCQAYNVMEPGIPYPDRFELNHDGVYVNLECEDIATGKIFIVTYWGD